MDKLAKTLRRGRETLWEYHLRWKFRKALRFLLVLGGLGGQTAFAQAANYCGFAPGSLAAPPISIMNTTDGQIYCGTGVFIGYDPSFGGANQYTFFAATSSGAAIAGTFEIGTAGMIEGAASGVYPAQNIIIEMEWGGGGTPYIDSPVTPPPVDGGPYYGDNTVERNLPLLAQYESTADALLNTIPLSPFDRARYSQVLT